MIIIRVLGNDGRGVNYARVYISWSNGNWSQEFTDINGYACFNGSGNGTVYVDGQVV